MVLGSLGFAFYFSDSCLFLSGAESSEMTQAKGLVLAQVYGQKNTALWECTWINLSIDEEDLLTAICEAYFGGRNYLWILNASKVSMGSLEFAGSLLKLR